MNGPDATRIPPYHRLAYEPLWARNKALAIRRISDPAGKAEILWRYRLQAIEDSRFTKPITDVMRFLKDDKDIGLLAKSIRIELGDAVENINIPAGTNGIKLHYAARLLILADEIKAAKDLLKRHLLVKGRIIGMLMRDPNPTVMQTADAF